MRTLSVFNFISLDGYYKGLNQDISWHRHGGEEAEYASKNANGGSTLLFGRITYQMMENFWPTEDAIQQMPKVAKGMNNAEKIVFSNTLKKTDWNNTRIISGDIVKQITALKQMPGNSLTLLGSGSILTQFAQAGLIDEYIFMLDPVAIGSGTSVFRDLEHKLDLELTASKAFKSGVLLLNYVPKG
jgi:dihydrofolate reductase